APAPWAAGGWWRPSRLRPSKRAAGKRPPLPVRTHGQGLRYLGSPINTKAAQYLGWANGFTSFGSAFGSDDGGATFSASWPLPRATPSVIVPSRSVASSSDRLRSQSLASASASALPIAPFSPAP